MRSGLPQGQVTLLFTDVEGSTQLLHEIGPERYAEQLGEHRRRLREAFTVRGGVEVDTQGDAFFVSFPSAQEAVAAAAAAQAAVSSGSVRVRMGLHTGRPHLAAEGYVGEDVHLGARIAAAGHGGQVLLSAATRSLVEADTTDLGEHRLKDFAEPVPIFQLGSERFAPLKTISNTNLPRPASSFVRREREVAELVALVRGPDRLVTLTGPGGSGKTRLAIEAAAEVIGDFKAGVFWVGLAPLRDSALVLEEIGRTLGAKGDLASHVAERQMLLLLDNFEQVVDAAPSLSSLLQACLNLRLLVTSRALLRIDGESEFPVLPLEHSEAVALFAARARVDEDATVAEVCQRLDNLPLAVELAAARVRVLAPVQILERLTQRVDLLKGGRDADPRQQTLRATIAWSHDLLDGDERRLFARLSVFAGGCTLETAESVVDADIDTLQSLVEKSLVRHTAQRFWMLETIREYAAEQLREPEVAAAYAAHYLAFAQAADVELRERPETWLDRLDAEHDNFRCGLDHFVSTGQSQEALALAAALARFWTMRGHFTEGRARLEQLLSQDERPTAARARALHGTVALVLGQADIEAAERYGNEALALHRSLGDEHGVAYSLYQLGAVAGEAEDFERAMRLTAESVELFRALGDDFLACQALLNLGYDHQCVGDLAGGQLLLEKALEEARAAGNAAQQARALGQLAVGERDQGRHTDALPMLAESLEIWARVGDPAMIARELRRVAYSLAKLGRAEPAAQLLAASEAAREGAGHFEAWIPRINDEILGDIHARLDPDAFDDAWRAGAELTVEEALDLTRSEVGLRVSALTTAGSEGESTTMETTGTAPLAAGWAALKGGDWERARASFEESLLDGETPEAHEGIGVAAQMLNEDTLTFDARERAYRLYLERGDKASAARIAAWLAADRLMFRGEPAIANGWLQRAHSLIDGLEPGIDHGWLAIHEGHMAIAMDEDTAKARQLAARAVELGRAFGAPELEMLGLGLEGRALVSEGELEEGMRRLDEATTVALQGEASLLYCVAWACCYLISACERVRDYERAAQWCARVGEFCGQHDIFLLNICRAHYASVLSWQGRWDEAESQLSAAVDGLQAARPPMVGDALARLGELRRRQGRPSDAEELFARSETHSITLLGRAALALDRGQPSEAAELADRYLRRFPDPSRVERGAGLEVSITALARLGEHEHAEKSLQQLREIATRARTRPLLAALRSSEGTLAAARGDHEAARRSYEDAIDLLTASDARFEAARVRLDLASSLSALGRDDRATREIESAITGFRELGADTELVRAEAMLPKLRKTASMANTPLAALSNRELEVLRLVAEGLTNHEIAQRLVLSEHTVNRHVANILRKLGLPTRAAAASLAGRHGLE